MLNYQSRLYLLLYLKYNSKRYMTIPKNINKAPKLVKPSDVPKRDSASFPLITIMNPHMINNAGTPYAITFTITSQRPFDILIHQQDVFSNQLKSLWVSFCRCWTGTALSVIALEKVEKIEKGENDDNEHGCDVGKIQPSFIFFFIKKNKQMFSFSCFFVVIFSYKKTNPEGFVYVKKRCCRKKGCMRCCEKAWWWM